MPLSLRGLPRDRAARRIAFIEKFMRVPRGHCAGERVRLREFQKDIIRGAFTEGVQTALVSLPRANGKTCLAAMLGLAELWLGPDNAEVIVVASDQRQAELTLKLAREIVVRTPALEERCHIFRDRISVPQNGAVLQPLPAEPDALHGHDPSLLIVDELHVVNREVWEAATTAAGKRPASLTLTISTPSNSPDTVMWDLVQHGRSSGDPAFWLTEYAAPDGCAVDDRVAWRTANPALACDDPFLDEKAMAALLDTIREGTFRQLRLGQWVSQAEGWLPWGAWDACADEHRVVRRGERVVLGFDGSVSGDSTVLLGCTVDDPHIFVVDIWADDGDPRWRVPRSAVDAAVDAAFGTWEVVQLAADPWGWRSEIETWASRHGETRVLEFNTGSAARMGPATDRLYQAVMGKAVSHDGDGRLAAHIANAVAKSTTHGDLVTKDRRNSPRKIDACVGAILAFDRAAVTAHAAPKVRKATAFGF